MELGILPAPADSEPYLELAGQGGARRFRKHILNLGPLIHPKTGKILQLDEAWYSRLKRNFDAGVCDIVQVPLADKDNKHSEAPERNTGRVVGLEKDGTKVYELLDIADNAIADKLGKTLLGASAFLSLDYTDTRTGQKVGPTLLHSCITNRPYVVGLEDYTEVLAATAADVVLPDGSTWTDAADPLMLCYSEVDPPELMLADPEPELYPALPDYGGPAMSQEDQWRDEIGLLGLEAQRVSSGLPSRPLYGGVITDHDRQAALSAEAEITDEDILLAAGELAGDYQVSTDAVHAMCHDAHIRSGLGRSELERARVLGEVQVALSAGRLEVSDEQVVALSQLYGGEEEVLRLTAESDLEDMFTGLAHPSKSGVLVDSKSTAHVRDIEDEDPQDHDQPHRGGDVHEKLRKIFERNPHLFTDGTGHEGGKGRQSYGPRPAYPGTGPSGKPQSSR